MGSFSEKALAEWRKAEVKLIEENRVIEDKMRKAVEANFLRLFNVKPDKEKLIEAIEEVIREAECY